MPANSTMAQYDAYKTPATGGALVVAALTATVNVKVDDEVKTAVFTEGATVTDLKYKDQHGIEQTVTGAIDAIVWDYHHIYRKPINCPYEVESNTKSRVQVRGFVIDASTEANAMVVFVPVFAITDPGTVAADTAGDGDADGGETNNENGDAP